MIISPALNSGAPFGIFLEEQNAFFRLVTSISARSPYNSIPCRRIEILKRQLRFIFWLCLAKPRTMKKVIDKRCLDVCSAMIFSFQFFFLSE